MKRIFRTLTLLAFISVTAISCGEKINPDDNSGDGNTNKDEVIPAEGQENLKAMAYLKNEIMDDYYYWYTQIPDVKYTYKTDIYDYFDDLLYKKDRWSWMMDGQEYIADESGVIYGTFGASFGQLRDPEDSQKTLDYDVYVRYVYPDSPCSKAGVKRGWKLDRLDGQSVADYWLSSSTTANQFNNIIGSPSITKAHSFGFITPEGEDITLEITAAESLNTRPCLIKRVFTPADYPGLKEPVGYFHYLGFKADMDINGKSMLEDITEPMAMFKEQNVKTVIVDLRYNGGGDSRASDLLVSYLAPESARGKVYVSRKHNDKLASENESQTVADPLDLISKLESTYNFTFECKPSHPGFEKLYFITGYGSASASEMSLNGLQPLADVQHVGGVTYGKPNGMYVFMYPYDRKSRSEYNKDDYHSLRYVFLPICFYNQNGEGVNIPDDGMKPNNIRPDDIYHDFGPEEDNIAACLYHIVNGSYPELTKAKVRTSASGSKGGIKVRLTPEETNENYGLYTVKPDFL